MLKRNVSTQLVLAASTATFALLATCLIVRRADAVSTRSFILDDAASLAAGELEGTAVHSDGSVTIGADVQRIELSDIPVAAALERGSDGATYIGTGNNGKILRLRGDQIDTFAETGQLLVTSLTFGAGGTLYAGTLPEGKIFAIDPQGQVREFVRPESSEHIWDLAWDARRNTLYAATGPEGRVYSINAAGSATVYYDSDASHVMSLALDTEGVLYAGTSDAAHVVRLRGEGQSEVVFDFPGNEITSIAVRNGILAVAANDFPEPPRVAGTTVSRTSNVRPTRPGPGKGRLWRVGRDGRAEQLFANDEGHFAAVQIADDSTFFVASGQEGRIYRVEANRRSSTWIDVDERQVLAMDLIGSSPLFVTGDAGAVYRVRHERPATAMWTSKVLDAGFQASFGQLTWRGSGNVEFQTRSGNTDDPDDSWTDWSQPIRTPGPNRSPAARFLQIRANFAADPNAMLLAVRAYYLPQNQRATIQNIGLKPVKRDKNRSIDDPPVASTVYDLTWTVDNPDEDRLRYRIRYRSEGQTRFRDAFEETVVLTESEYAWNTNAIPDGWYVIQVEATDELANPGTTMLSTTSESEPLLVDNHPPRIEALAVRNGVVSGRALDTLGPIQRLEYAIDGETFRLVFPLDGFLDTNDERFEFSLPADLSPGDHIIAVKAYDAGGNSVVAEVLGR